VTEDTPRCPVDVKHPSSPRDAKTPLVTRDISYIPFSEASLGEASLGEASLAEGSAP
jgi:hypothetical protein